MDIRLTTNSATAALELRNLQRFGDKSDFIAFLIVRSGAFAAALPFLFEQKQLTDFARDVEAMAEARGGSATLRSAQESGSITFELEGSGRVRVFGVLLEPEEHEQRLEFSFGTDQACLRPFATELATCR